MSSILIRYDRKGSTSSFRKGKSPLCHQISGVIESSRFRFWVGYTTSTEKEPENYYSSTEYLNKGHSRHHRVFNVLEKIFLFVISH
jgi:hypothetical protein